MEGPVRVLRVLDRDYPTALRDLRSPPDPLCVRGEILPGPAVAIVGTRDASPGAVGYTRELATRLVLAGIAVWSGGAVGIDAAAHRGALEAGGTTVAVVGTGLEHCYPAAHASLYDAIVAAGGAIVSPFDPDQHATLTTFPQRNAILAAMTRATVVVQAPRKSGARSTARWARRLGRPLLVVPGAPWDLRSQGCCEELRLGAIPFVDDDQLLRCLQEFRHPLGGAGGPAPNHLKDADAQLPLFSVPTSPENGLLDDEEADSAVQSAVLRWASETPRHADDFCLKTGFAAGLVHAALLTLTLRAVLVEGPAGWFRAVTVRNS